MANLPEQKTWIDGIYQLETSDPVVGGPGGISNRQAEQLASRTTYLKSEQEKTGSDLATHVGAVDPHTQYAPKASPALTGTPTAPTAAQTANSNQIATTAFVKAAITTLINGSPAALDTLQELANSLGNDPDFRTTVLNAIADSKADATNKLNAHASTLDAHPQYAPKASPAFTGTPTAPTAASGSNDTQLATTAFVKVAIAALVNGSPAALDTLQELANALGNDPNFSTTILNALAGKLAKDQNGADIPDKSQFRQNMGLSNVMMTGDFGWGGVSKNIQSLWDNETWNSYLKDNVSQIWRQNAPVSGSTASMPPYSTGASFKSSDTYGAIFFPIEDRATHRITAYGGDDSGQLKTVRWIWDHITLPIPHSTGKGFVVNDKGMTEQLPVNTDEYLNQLAQQQSAGSRRFSNGDWKSHLSVRHLGGVTENGDNNNTLYGWAIIDENMVSDGSEFYIYKQNNGTWLPRMRLYHSANLTPSTIGAMPASELAGMPQLFPGAVAPAGWLKCNGQQFDTAQFPVLASRYPSGFLPDLRGEFVRGWDDGRGVDVGRALLSGQSDELKSHAHGNVPKYLTPGGDNDRGGSFSWFSIDDIGITGAEGGTETRPRNIAFNYIVRAA
ncbi:phage tail protein [Pectobacterium zantedeschiae]|uniref:phage tail protein n=1 Tax=Pectobacterium zantedeschiae TaxID=2034769 RepID=UPI00101BE7CA|nr:phage tail protein [Pectobacterium zantedeschiae]RYC42874.1 phage tail protein [Pectobacterium zantedeschiae]